MSASRDVEHSRRVGDACRSRHHTQRLYRGAGITLSGFTGPGTGFVKRVITTRGDIAKDKIVTTAVTKVDSVTALQSPNSNLATAVIS